MPNHVKNIVKMNGITNMPLFREEDGQKCFDFNKVIPMPESLNIESGSMTDESIMYYLTERCTIPVRCLKPDKKDLVKKLIQNSFSKGEFLWAEEIFRRVMEKTYEEPESKKAKIYEAGRTYISNYQKYGATTWYDWCCTNWGTKWNAYSNKQEDEDTISFETAWSNPEPVMLKLSEMYPEAVIEHWWADEDMGSNDGHKIYRGGVNISGDYCDQCSNEAYEIYIKCWGENECLNRDEYGKWYRRDCDTCHRCD